MVTEPQFGSDTHRKGRFDRLGPGTSAAVTKVRDRSSSAIVFHSVSAPTYVRK